MKGREKMFRGIVKGRSAELQEGSSTTDGKGPPQGTAWGNPQAGEPSLQPAWARISEEGREGQGHGGGGAGQRRPRSGKTSWGGLGDRPC